MISLRLATALACKQRQHVAVQAAAAPLSSDYRGDVQAALGQACSRRHAVCVMPDSQAIAGGSMQQPANLLPLYSIHVVVLGSVFAQLAFCLRSNRDTVLTGPGLAHGAPRGACAIQKRGTAKQGLLVCTGGGLE